MIEIGTLLAIMYVLLVGIFAFVMIYPFFRDICRDFFTSRGAGEVMAFCLSLMGIAYGFFVMFYLITSFIVVLLFFLSMFSGLELIYLSRSFRINLALFIVSLTLPIWSLIIQEVAPIVYLVKGIIYLIGVGEGAGKHLSPLVRDFYAEFNGQSYAEGFVVLFMAVCILTVVLHWFGIEVSSYLQIAPDLSDVGFVVGGLLGYLILRFTKRRKMS
jgi:hypothetical protein